MLKIDFELMTHYILRNFIAPAVFEVRLNLAHELRKSIAAREVALIVNLSNNLRSEKIN